MQLINKHKFLERLNKYKYLFIVPIVILIIALIIYSSYNFYLVKKANKNSLAFSQIQENLVSGNEKDAVELLKELSRNGTNGYKFISYLQQASLNLHNKDYIKAMENIKQINKLSLPIYYKELSNYIYNSIRLENEKDLTLLIEDLKKSATPKNSVYYSNLELLAVALYKMKDYKEAINNLNIIIDSNNAPNGVVERAKSVKSLVLAYAK